MNGYICFYNGKRFEVHCVTMFEAKQKAIAHFKVTRKNEYKVSVHLAEKNGEEVIHTATF